MPVAVVGLKTSLSASFIFRFLRHPLVLSAGSWWILALMVDSCSAFVLHSRSFEILVRSNRCPLFFCQAVATKATVLSANTHAVHKSKEPNEPRHLTQQPICSDPRLFQIRDPLALDICIVARLAALKKDNPERKPFIAHDAINKSRQRLSTKRIVSKTSELS